MIHGAHLVTKIDGVDLARQLDAATETGITHHRPQDDEDLDQEAHPTLIATSQAHLHAAGTTIVTGSIEVTETEIGTGTGIKTTIETETETAGGYAITTRDQKTLIGIFLVVEDRIDEVGGRGLALEVVTDDSRAKRSLLMQRLFAAYEAFHHTLLFNLAPAIGLI